MLISASDLLSGKTQSSDLLRRRRQTWQLAISTFIDICNDHFGDKHIVSKFLPHKFFNLIHAVLATTEIPLQIIEGWGIAWTRMIRVYSDTRSNVDMANLVLHDSWSRAPYMHIHIHPIWHAPWLSITKHPHRKLWHSIYNTNNWLPIH